MSQINFDSLVDKHPDLKQALRELEAWMESHSNVRIIIPGTLIRELSGLDAETLARALRLLVRAGFLQQVYKVTTPSGVLAEGEFDDPTQIPSKLPDRRERYFDTAESDLVSVFRTVAQ